MPSPSLPSSKVVAWVSPALPLPLPPASAREGAAPEKKTSGKVGLQSITLGDGLGDGQHVGLLGKGPRRNDLLRSQSSAHTSCWEDRPTPVPSTPALGGRRRRGISSACHRVVWFLTVVYNDMSIDTNNNNIIQIY